jgi:hypothetical protein
VLFLAAHKAPYFVALNVAHWHRVDGSSK